MAAGSNWVVHKFGGSSVADAACFRRVAAIIEARTGERPAVVLSACRGVTDALYALVDMAERREDAEPAIAALRTRHVDIAAELLSGESAARYADELDNDLRDIRGVRHAIELTRSAASNVRDLVAGYGEIWSSKLFAAYLRERGQVSLPVAWIDARQIIVVDHGPLGPIVDWQRSRDNISNSEATGDSLLVITGFVASNKLGAQTIAS